MDRPLLIQPLALNRHLHLTVNPSLDLDTRRSLSASVFKTLTPGAVLILIYVSAAILVQPFVNLPFHDDWTYAWSVEHLLKTGKLQVLDWSVHYPFTQILWGALFCLPYGFSFLALRVSTVVLAWFGALALYGTLREFGRTRSESLIATVILVTHPVFFVLSFSFMTDVPFVSVANIAFFFIVRGLCRRNSLELCAGCAFAVCALFIRQVAVAIPGSLLLYFLFAPSHRNWRYLLPTTGFCLLCSLLLISIPQIFGVTSQSKFLTTWVIDFWLHHYSQAVQGVLRILMHGGLALLPLSLPLVASVYRRPLFWGTVSALFILTGCSILFGGEIPNPQDGMWQLNTLGRERRLLQGPPVPDFLPSWLNAPLFILFLFSFAVIIVKVVDVIRAGIGKAIGLFVWYASIQFALIMVLWFFGPWGSDRYAVVLLPPLIVLLANSQLRSRIALASIAVLFALSMLATWNENQTSRAIAEALAWLRGKDVPLAHIDAGYVFNGWNLYAHPENLSPGTVPERDVPLVTSRENKPYVIAASPIAGYRVIRDYSWYIHFTSFNYKVYVLEQLPQRSKNKD
jgi:Dolichyl-phosphate-mannose-protein mannosyltransferase